MQKKGVIGVFDSGVGGLTVLSELVKLLPSYSFIYFADTANCPYGPKGKEEIIHLSDRITKFLISKGADIIIVACNTATASAIDFLRSNYSIPFVGMEPAIKPAALATKTNSVGVLATAGTFNGRLYRETSQKYAVNIKVNYQIGEGLVELVEQQKTNTDEAKLLLQKYTQPMLDDNIDHLVLGCTHYPFFTSVLKTILPKHIVIVDAAPAVAKQAFRIINEIKLQSNHCYPTSVIFYSSGDTTVLENLVTDTEKQNGLVFSGKSFAGNINPSL